MFRLEIAEILNKFSVDENIGLSDEDVQKYIEQNGKNKLREKKKKSLLSRFANQFKDVMIIILLVAAAVSFGVALYDGSSSAENFFEPALILVIVLINATMGVIQESKAEKSLDALKSLSAKHARVIRDSKENVIDAENLVPGDIILLEAGDFVPADSRIISCTNLTSDESMLTGESVPAEKNADAIKEENVPLAEMKNTLFSGCSIATGVAKAVVTQTGMDTQVAKIADLLDKEGEQTTPLQEKLGQLGKYLGFIALGACAVIFVVGWISGIDVLEMFITSVSLAVAAIPEGLPAIITIVLSIGVQRMVKKNAIIRRLPVVEALGSATVICSDKTGTLTQNKMTVTQVFVNGKYENITDENSEMVCSLLTLATLCTDATVNVTEKGETCIGDPTETSIISAALKNGIEKEKIAKNYPRLYEIPFDSDRKLMSTVNNFDGVKMVIVKGAYDVLEKICVNKNMQKFRNATEQMSSQALRVLAVACKRYDDDLPVDGTDMTVKLESNLELIGLVGMIDPPRPEVQKSVEVCRRAGIKPVMITGDHIATASAIAGELGILEQGGDAVTGMELSAMTDEQLLDKVENIAVYARVSPEDKIRIVKAWQEKNNVVAMTGDGVNDAPALKAADIGCAMGVTGTDVAKEAADMTLTDDNFSTIVDAVKEGRGIYANIRKVVGYLLGTNLGEVLLVFFSMILWRETPLLSMQLLWINLVTDSFPAIGLGMEDVEANVMRQKPRGKDEGIFSNGLGIQIILQGVMFGALALFAFKYAYDIGGITYGRTMSFFVLALSQVLQAFNMKSTKSLFSVGVFSNKNLNIAVIISLLLIVVVLFTPLYTLFGFVPLDPIMYAEAIGLALIPTVIQEILKAFKIFK